MNIDKVCVKSFENVIRVCRNSTKKLNIILAETFDYISPNTCLTHHRLAEEV